MNRDETTRTGADLDSHVPVLDPDAVRALHELLAGDREALTAIVDVFVDEAPLRLAELRRGADEGDAALAGRAAHTLKSNGSIFGASGLVSLCRRLEVAARANELAGSADLIDRIEMHWALVRREVTALRGGWQV
jgi:HPt (histidine-containing phosphotransfer) domain-containing protein